MTVFARAERAALVDTLLAAGPDAPTLCEGWTTRDLAAHLVLRERRPDASAGIMLKPVAGYTKKVQARLAAGDYPQLVAKLRTPALWVRPGFADEAINLIEFFIHLEDIRRATPGWTPRVLDQGHEQALRARARGSARLAARRFPARVLVRTPGLEPFTVGAGGEELTADGAPGELLMFFTGRQRAADVELSGPAALVERLKGARLGL
jgi:uncharacterized protein (TIGR03085 family)